MTDNGYVQKAKNGTLTPDEFTQWMALEGRYKKGIPRIFNYDDLLKELEILKVCNGDINIYKQIKKKSL